MQYCSETTSRGQQSNDSTTSLRDPEQTYCVVEIVRTMTQRRDKEKGSRMHIGIGFSNMFGNTWDKLKFLE
jgi:hypothetical protein